MRTRRSPEALTFSHIPDYLSKLVSRRRIPMNRAARDEADLQTPQSQAGQQARVSREDEDPRRPRRALPPTEEGSLAAGSLGGREVGTSGQGPGESLPKAARIRRSSEIREILERGKRKRTASLDVFFAPSPASFSRLGVIVAKQGRRIVERNLLKRRLREIGRRRVLPELSARGVVSDVLIRARGRAYDIRFEDLASEVLGAVEAMWSRSS
jgi:ribonuclease P protein component